MTFGPSEHLAWTELACKDGTPYPMALRDTAGYALGVMFERFRQFVGVGPLHVLSGYRTPAYNRRIGGAVASQHLVGRAIDLATPAGYLVGQFHALGRTFYETGNIAGLGLYPWGVHLDCRLGRRALWTSDASKDARG